MVNYPDFMVFDLDPYIYAGTEVRGAEPALNRPAFARTCDVAFALKGILDDLGLPSFVKTTGRTGLHVFVPILRHFDFDTVRAAAGTIDRFLLKRHPDLVTIEWTVSRRNGKVFLDTNRNARGKTLAAAYSPRVSGEAAVSMPITWDELPDVYPTDFTLHTVPARLDQRGDAWAGVMAAKHDLRPLLEATGG